MNARHLVCRLTLARHSWAGSIPLRRTDFGGVIRQTAATLDTLVTLTVLRLAGNKRQQALARIEPSPRTIIIG